MNLNKDTIFAHSIFFPESTLINLTFYTRLGIQKDKIGQGIEENYQKQNVQKCKI